MVFVLVLFLSGCATDKYYDAAKTIYIAGKKVVIANWDNLPDSTKKKLQEIDKAAKTYDATRSVLKPAIENAAKKLDVNSTSTNNQKHQSK